MYENFTSRSARRVSSYGQNGQPTGRTDQILGQSCDESEESLGARPAAAEPTSGVRPPAARLSRKGAAGSRVGRRRDDRLLFDDPLPGDRRSWAVPPGHGTYQGLDLERLDRDDEDERTFLLEAQHLDMEEALKKARAITRPDGEPMNPRLHVSLHVVVANQLLADDPPETWQAVQRLAGLGYDWHNVMHLIMGPVTEAVYGALSERQPFDRADYVRQLADCPALALPRGTRPPLARAPVAVNSLSGAALIDPRALRRRRTAAGRTRRLVSVGTPRSA